jgi:hypothetical protein
MNDKIVINSDRKFDLQLSQALINERRLAEILAREAHKRGRWRSGAGDDGRFDVILLSLRDLLR